MRFCQALFLKIWSDKILLFSAIFCPFTPLTTLKIKIWKNINSTCRYYSFTHEYCKWRSYDICFLRYGEWQTKFFVILPHYQPDESIFKKIKKKKKKKKCLEISSFYMCVPKIMITWCMNPEIRCMRNGWTDRQMNENTHQDSSGNIIK